MTANNYPSPLATLILAWLLSHADGGTPRQIDDALRAIVKQRWTPTERQRALEAEIGALVQAGSLVRQRRAAYALSAAGRRAALAALGGTSLPTKTTWRAIKSQQLFALALDVPRGPQPFTSDQRRAVVLARHRGVEAGSPPSLATVKHALARRLLGLGPGAPLTVDAIIEVLFRRMLGSEAPIPMREALERLTSEALGAGTADLDEVVLSRWLQGSEVVPLAQVRALGWTDARATVPAPSEPRTELPGDDGAFAMRVLAAARASKTGRFGDNKVFISHVLRQLTVEGFAIDDTDSVKARLVAAHQGGLLSLSRADLVEAMAPEDVDASETRYRRATFHFVRI
jgi:hypothetical protein